MLPRIQALRATLTQPGCHQALVEAVLAQAGAPAANVFTALLAEPALAAARSADARLARG